MRARRGCEDEEKLDQTELIASRSSNGKASKDYLLCVSKKKKAQYDKQRETYMLELEICALVCHSLVSNAEFSGWGRLERVGTGFWFGIILDDGLWDYLVVGIGKTGCGEGIADVGGGGWWLWNGHKDGHEEEDGGEWGYIYFRVRLPSSRSIYATCRHP